MQKKLICAGTFIVLLCLWSLASSDDPVVMDTAVKIDTTIQESTNKIQPDSVSSDYNMTYLGRSFESENLYFSHLYSQAFGKKSLFRSNCVRCYRVLTLHYYPSGYFRNLPLSTGKDSWNQYPWNLDGRLQLNDISNFIARSNRSGR